MASRRLSTSREKNKQMVKFKWCNQNLQVPILKSFKCKINLHKWQLDIGRADTRHGQSEANQVANLNQLKNQFNSSKLINKQKQFSRTLFYKIIINSGEKKKWKRPNRTTVFRWRKISFVFRHSYQSAHYLHKRSAWIVRRSPSVTWNMLRKRHAALDTNQPQPFIFFWQKLAHSCKNYNNVQKIK